MIERLRDVAFCGSEEHQSMLWSIADLSDEIGVGRRSFIRRVVQVGVERGIPLYCCAVRGHNAISIYHCIYRQALGDDDWSVIVSLVDEAVIRERAKACLAEDHSERVKGVAWGGMSMPSWFFLDLELKAF